MLASYYLLPEVSWRDTLFWGMTAAGQWNLLPRHLHASKRSLTCLGHRLLGDLVIALLQRTLTSFLLSPSLYVRSAKSEALAAKATAWSQMRCCRQCSPHRIVNLFHSARGIGVICGERLIEIISWIEFDGKKETRVSKGCNGAF